MKMQSSKRNSSIELLRIIAMCGVVILHYNNEFVGGALNYVKKSSVNQLYLYISENIFICAVDLFIMISAFFLVNTKTRRLIRIFELIVQVILFNLAYYLVFVFVGSEEFNIRTLIKWSLPVNYFVILYSVLYIISPYINILIENMTKLQFKKCLIILIFLFSIWSFGVDVLMNWGDVNGMSTVSRWGSGQGYTIVNFVLVYFVGAYIRINNLNIGSKRVIIYICIGVFILLCISAVNEVAWNYNNPIIIIIAGLVLCLFKNFEFSNRIIDDLARGTFTCFLFHGHFMSRLGIEKVVNQNVFILVGHQIGCAVGLYLLSYIVYKVYDFLSAWFFRLINPLIDKIDIYDLNE